MHAQSLAQSGIYLLIWGKHENVKDAAQKNHAVQGTGAANQLAAKRRSRSRLSVNSDRSSSSPYPGAPELKLSCLSTPQKFIGILSTIL
jgi:hypothetical protein